MFWLLVLSIVFLGVGVIVFVLTRDSFRASRARRETPCVALSVEKISDAATINTLMHEKLAGPTPSNPATLFSGQGGKETDVLADTLAQVKETPMLPTAPKAYLRMEERDESLERLLLRHAQGQGSASRTPLMPPREFSIEAREKKEGQLEHENVIPLPETWQKDKKT